MKEGEGENGWIEKSAEASLYRYNKFSGTHIFQKTILEKSVFLTERL